MLLLRPLRLAARRDAYASVPPCLLRLGSILEQFALESGLAFDLVFHLVGSGNEILTDYIPIEVKGTAIGFSWGSRLVVAVKYTPKIEKSRYAGPKRRLRKKKI